MDLSAFELVSEYSKEASRYVRASPDQDTKRLDELRMELMRRLTIADDLEAKLIAAVNDIDYDVMGGYTMVDVDRVEEVVTATFAAIRNGENQ